MTMAQNDQPYDRVNGSGHKEIKLSTGGYATFTTYSTTPENPGRTRIAYTVFPEVPTNAKKEWDAEIWLCDIDGGNHAKLCDVHSIDPHNGARFDWLDDETLFYFSDGRGKGTVSIIRIDGTVLDQRTGYPGEREHDGKALVFQVNQVDPDDGIHSLDVRRGTYTKLIDFGDIAPFGAEMNGHAEMARWRITHPRYSLDGTKVAFNIENKRAFLFTMDADGSNLQMFGVKPLHWYWYEGNTFVGQDMGVGRGGKPGDSTGRRWDASGRWIEDVSGRGNHMAVSPNGLLFASDSDYHSDPVVLKWYRKGDLSGTTIFSSSYSSAVWANGKAHVNPSFARDSSRIYYAKPTGPNKVEAFYVELTEDGVEGCREAEA